MHLFVCWRMIKMKIKKHSLDKLIGKHFICLLAEINLKNLCAILRWRWNIASWNLLIKLKKNHKLFCTETTERVCERNQLRKCLIHCNGKLNINKIDWKHLSNIFNRNLRVKLNSWKKFYRSVIFFIFMENVRDGRCLKKCILIDIYQFWNNLL